MVPDENNGPEKVEVCDVLSFQMKNYIVLCSSVVALVSFF